MNQASPPAFVSFLPIILMVGIFYFLLIRPQQKQAKTHQKMLEGLAKGDRVLTSGGIYATITIVKGPELEVKIAENVKIMIARSAVASLIPAESAAAIQP